MHIESIRELEMFDALQSDWESVREQDPHSTIFGSWGWLRGWMAATRDQWIVLTATPHGCVSPVAFLPLGIRSKSGLLQLRDESELFLAGAPMADRSGLICLPGFEARALRALEQAMEDLMERVGALRFAMDEVSDPRWESFLQRFRRSRFMVRRSAPSPCPLFRLPPRWDDYMQGSKKRRALLRRAEREGFVVTHVEDATLERYTEIFLELHQLRFGPKPSRYLDTMRELVRWTHRSGTLYMVVVWQGAAPMAVNVGFLDRFKRAFHAYNGGWDAWYRKFSPRRIAELYSIRWAIESGFRTYDLGRGGERYKFDYGAVERFNGNWTLVRRTPYSSAREFVRQLPEMLPGRDGTL